MFWYFSDKWFEFVESRNSAQRLFIKRIVVELIKITEISCFELMQLCFSNSTRTRR